MDEADVQTLLALTIEAARKAGMISKTSVERAIVDTTVMPKAIVHPTDTRLLERRRQRVARRPAGQGTGPAAARRVHSDAKNEGEEKAVCVARARGRVHLQGKGQYTR